LFAASKKERRTGGDEGLSVDATLSGLVDDVEVGVVPVGVERLLGSALVLLDARGLVVDNSLLGLL